MTVTAVRKDPQTLSMTLEAEFDASPERVWQLWADPRQLIAGSTVLVLMVLVVFLASQRYFQTSIATTGLKG